MMDQAEEVLSDWKDDPTGSPIPDEKLPKISSDTMREHHYNLRLTALNKLRERVEDGE